MTRRIFTLLPFAATALATVPLAVAPLKARPLAPRLTPRPILRISREDGSRVMIFLNSTYNDLRVVHETGELTFDVHTPTVLAANIALEALAPLLQERKTFTAEIIFPDITATTWTFRAYINALDIGVEPYKNAAATILVTMRACTPTLS